MGGVISFQTDFPGTASRICWGVCVCPHMCVCAGGETEARMMAKLEPKHLENQCGTWRGGVGQVSSPVNRGSFPYKIMRLFLTSRGCRVESRAWVEADLKPSRAL